MQVMEGFNLEDICGMISERVNHPGHPEFGEMQRMLNDWVLAHISELGGYELHDLMNEDMDRWA